ncbi:MAG: hypothetical protein ACRDLF_07800 [Solirubrobacteraceae bacterium]
MDTARIANLRDDTARIANLRDWTSVDERTGAVRSVQTADLLLSEEAMRGLWSPEHLERLARTYWRFLTRVTLGLIRVRYTEHERFVVLLFRPFKLLTFQAPEYELDADHGVVSWRIERGLLVTRAGRHGKGRLRIEVRRCPSEGGRDSDTARLHVEVEVANFYPTIAFRLGRRIYNATQSRIHVLVTNGFLRSLARLDLAESRVGQLSRTARRRTTPAASRGRGAR